MASGQTKKTAGLKVFRAESSVEIYVLDDIDGARGFSSRELQSQLSGVPKSTPLTVYINSYGGEVFEGLAIYNTLRNWQGHVTTIATGIAASVSSLIFLAGDQREIYDNAQVMIHNPFFGRVSGDARDLQQASTLAAKTEQDFVRMYASRTGQKQVDIETWMSQQRFFSAREAYETGFATRVIEPDSQLIAKMERFKMPDQNNNDQNPTDNAGAADPQALAASGQQDPMAAYRERFATEHERVDAINQFVGQNQELCMDPEYLNQFGTQSKTLRGFAAFAIKKGWTVDRFELEARRASKPRIGDFMHQPNHDTVISQPEEVVGCNAAKMFGWKTDNYSDQVNEAADRMPRGSFLGLAEGYLKATGQWQSTMANRPDDVLRTLQGAGVSSSTFDTILGNAMHKEVSQLFRAAPSVARTIAKKLNANDFKTHYRVGLSDYDGKPEELPADGNMKHSMIKDKSTTYSINTYARITKLSRRDIINDDAGVFEDLPRAMAQGSITKIERDFWTLVLSNPSSFWSSDNGNYLTGSDTALDDAALRSAVATMLEQTDSNGDFINTPPKYLVVAPANIALAQQLYNSTNMVGGTDSLPEANPHARKYEPLASPWIGANSPLTGGSDDHWWLWGDPGVLAAAGIAYLNGTDTPTIEIVELGSDQLGMGWRMWIDFGVAMLEEEAAIMNKGTA